MLFNLGTAEVDSPPGDRFLALMNTVFRIVIKFYLISKNTSFIDLVTSEVKAVGTRNENLGNPPFLSGYLIRGNGLGRGQVYNRCCYRDFNVEVFCIVISGTGIAALFMGHS